MPLLRAAPEGGAAHENGPAAEYVGGENVRPCTAGKRGVKTLTQMDYQGTMRARRGSWSKLDRWPALAAAMSIAARLMDAPF